MPLIYNYRDAHIDVPMTNVMIAYMQDPARAIASRVFASIGVEKASDIFFKFRKGEWFRHQMRKRAPGTPPAEAGFEKDQDTYRCEEFSLGVPIPWELYGNVDNPLTPDTNATNFLGQQTLMNEEIEFANAFLQTGIWSTQKQGVGSGNGTTTFTQWNDYTNSDPILDVRRWKTEFLLSTGREPNVMVLGRHVYDKLADHPDLIARTLQGGNNSQPAKVSIQAMQALFELEDLQVSTIVQNTAQEGAAADPTLAFVVGKTFLLAHRTTSPSVTIPSAGYIFRWKNFSRESNAEGVEVRRIIEPKPKKDTLIVGRSYDMKVTATDLGFFGYDVVA